MTTQILKQTKFLNLCETMYQNNNGKLSSWVFAERPNRQNAVLIVPLSLRTYDTELVVIKEFRIPINGYEYGFPAGLIEPDEPVEETIKRELKEETGLDFIRLLKPLSPAVYNSSGMSNEAVVIAFVEVEGNISNKNLEVSENIIAYKYKKNHVKLLMENLSKTDYERQPEFQNCFAGAKAWIIFDMFINTDYLQNLLIKE